MHIQIQGASSHIVGRTVDGSAPYIMVMPLPTPKSWISSPTWISGNKTASWLYGEWENETWGQYTLCASTAPALCIVMHTSEHTYVLSYESDDITAALYENICGLAENAK